MRGDGQLLGRLSASINSHMLDMKDRLILPPPSNMDHTTSLREGVSSTSYQE